MLFCSEQKERQYEMKADTLGNFQVNFYVRLYHLVASNEARFMLL